MLVLLSLFVLFRGVEMSGTCVGTPTGLFVLFKGVETSWHVCCTPQSVCVVSGS